MAQDDFQPPTPPDPRGAARQHNARADQQRILVNLLIRLLHLSQQEGEGFRVHLARVSSYIDEELGYDVPVSRMLERRRWFELGRKPDPSGLGALVHIRDSDNSTVLAGVPADLALQVIAAHNAALDDIDATD